MLEGLDAVDWSALTHAYGPAEDVPAMLRQLASGDPAAWVAGIDSLYWTIYHQGTVYDSTPKAVPVLIELLHYREVKCRGRILELLASVARGSSFLDARKDLSTYKEQRETAEFREQLERELETVRATRDAVWRGWETYLEAGSDVDESLSARFNGHELPISAKVLQEIPLDPGSIRPTNQLEIQLNRAVDNPRLAVGFASIVVEEVRDGPR
jgi:hypothetical protein